MRSRGRLALLSIGFVFTGVPACSRPVDTSSLDQLSCPPGQTLCGDLCVSPDHPGYGCGNIDCMPCDIANRAGMSGFARFRCEQSNDSSSGYQCVLDSCLEGYFGDLCLPAGAGGMTAGSPNLPVGGTVSAGGSGACGGNRDMEVSGVPSSGSAGAAGFPNGGSSAGAAGLSFGGANAGGSGFASGGSIFGAAGSPLGGANASGAGFASGGSIFGTAGSPSGA